MRDQRDRNLLADLDAFLQEHRRCGDLDSAVENDHVWMTCTCGAVLVRVVAFPKSPAPPKVFTVTLNAFLMAA